MTQVDTSAARLATTVRGTGPAVVLAHGAGGTVQANFGPLLAPLSRTLKVIGADLPGSGATPRSTGPLDLDDLADRLVATAVHEGAETFTVVGYSLGCATAVRAAVRHPDRVTGLVLTSGFAVLDEATRAKVQRWRTLAGGDRTSLARYVTTVMLGSAYLARMSHDQREGFIELVALTTPAGLLEQVDLVLSTDITADLASVAVPTLVIGTTQDQLIAPELTKALADGIPGARWATLDSGHAPALESAGAWTRLIEEFTH
ncbi:alpha/beta fold hydrolase [Umezawaea sp. NPDC059074]|uniref:alpha/beta fold hydrolase n=1 Tax=Umezawaea sp. NPDC059074 TaxID=3346716 RepID=UPI0036D0EAE8